MCTLQTRLEDEGNANQKLMAERTAADTKIKSLEEQMTLSEDNISKVIGLVKNLNPVSCTPQEKDLTKSVLSSLSLTDNLIQAISCKIFSLTHAAGKTEDLGVKNKFLTGYLIKDLTAVRLSDIVLSQTIYSCKDLYEMLSEKSVFDSEISTVKSLYSYLTQTIKIDSNKTKMIEFYSIALTTSNL